jgi:PAS domain S-box-containing protein
MELVLWGATSKPGLALPERSIGYIVLAAYVILFLLGIISRRRDFAQLGRRKGLNTFVLAATSIILSQLFLVVISSESQLPPFSSAQNSVAYLAPFGFVAFLIAGTTLNPLAALLIGFTSGLGRALWQTHQITDPFNYAFAAIIGAYLLQQNYNGRLYDWFRKPVIAGMFCSLILLPLIGLATFAYSDAGASNLEALDLALSTTRANILPLLIEGLLGGTIVSLLLIGLPQLQQVRPTALSPLALSLNTRLVATFLVFAGLLSFLLIVIGFDLAINLSMDLAVEQMARDTRAIAARIPDFRDNRQYLLARTSQIDGLRSGNTETQRAVLEQLFLSGPHFRSLFLVDPEGNVVTGLPGAASDGLTTQEGIAVEETFRSGAPNFSSAQELEDGSFVLSIMVPILNANEEPSAVLVGRVPDIAIEGLVAGLQGTLGEGVGFIVDEQNLVIGHPDRRNLLTNWLAPDGQKMELNGEFTEGSIFVGPQGSTNSRQLVYYQNGPDHPWQTVITLPYELVLGQALSISAQLAGVLLMAMLVTAGFLLLLGRSVTRPLMDLLRASQDIASGQLTTSIEPQGDDEIGRLGHAFGQMQLSLKRRLDELSLLLLVSQDVSKSIDLGQGMPTVLRGALRGTGAAGARIVVLNPAGRQPLTYAEGPASTSMAKYDRTIMRLLRRQNEMILSDPRKVSQVLKNGHGMDEKPNALVALPLITRDRFQGVFWITYRQAHNFDNIELSFLRTLSSQASVLVENARLYAMAEGGRRRLAAVLTSTTDAVIVTDPTERILLINPAMEQHFGLNSADVIGRPVTSVIHLEPLVKALTTDSKKTHQVEVATEDGKVMYTSASTIVNNEGQAIGRVAVLRDITHLKELDEMKSEFVATVSHDLRSPLTYMQGYATMLPMIGELEPKQEAYVSKILGGIRQMTTLVDDLLDLGRLEAGVDLKLGPVRVRELSTSLLDEFRQPAKENGLQLVSRPGEEVSEFIADSSLVRQAVANYINNAIKYAPNSGELLLFTEREGEDIVIGVIDNGPGISAQDQLRLFEKFYRVQESRKPQIKGSGLGLSLVRSIANRHEGRAWCESRLGVGSAFYISLPIKGPKKGL